jgi:hypothetical protein
MVQTNAFIYTTSDDQLWDHITPVDLHLFYCSPIDQVASFFERELFFILTSNCLESLLELVENGKVWTWINDMNESPKEYAPLREKVIKKMAIGGAHEVFLTDNNDVVTYGDNEYVALYVN